MMIVLVCLCAVQFQISKAVAIEAGAVVYGEKDLSFHDICSSLVFIRQIGMDDCCFLQAPDVPYVSRGSGCWNHS